MASRSWAHGDRDVEKADNDDAAVKEVPGRLHVGFLGFLATSANVRGHFSENSLIYVKVRQRFVEIRKNQPKIYRKASEICNSQI